ncbi:UDP-N-acetylmuramoyl-tripeptide--D-alanyl-D-alanine ligase [endosymbiont of Pachyrhynchus infernalis]|uniref:UDP-N-acetylmuramoyl-tripeptide--D-alanyl-D- alanine ligase n=1 Tax=endosymbiont of Pachyrhynchus infernalis TaxID=1971488 RepID=UPI000DC6D6CE|nr:UDP-N-acetylmuramoyl-tripeptide--D-alanyl-D-alanine ligase [endosymbiont of Pachyrhynchus infernalis]BBA84763.1 UDP-N-acetylmuramoyl-tripeptide--D-alanyl-D-alanine ligase [endosymbiont of Pachyrhynchus infernalis]
MINCTLKEISNIVNGKLIGKNKIINFISINSKNIKNKCLFIAFKGINFDSHIFVEDSIKNGAIAILVSKYFVNISIPQIIVNNVNNSFFSIAKFIRKKSNSYIIAITGSCGKTSIKEMTFCILKNIRKSYLTNKNENNIIGISLTLCNIEYYNMFVILEVGTDGLNQINNLIDIIEPNIVLISNLFISHFSKLNNYYNLIRAKGEILEKLSLCNRVILNFDSNNWNYWKFISFNKIPLFFSLNKLNNVDFYSENIITYNFKSSFILNSPIGKIKINLNVPGINNIYNSIAASAISILLGSNLNNIQKSLFKFKSINNRLKPIFISKNKIILDDTYNANLGSFISSSNLLSNINGYKVIIIADILELGNAEVFLHKRMGKIINNLNIDKVLSIGKLSYYITLNCKGEHFYNINNLIERIVFLIKKYNNIVILIKGSRKNRLDELIKILINKKNDNIIN